MPARSTLPALAGEAGAVARPTRDGGLSAPAGVPTGAPAGAPEIPYGDARDQLDTLAARLRRATLDVVWRQWRAVGAGTAGRARLRGLVDPEALVLCSLGLVEAERRLADIVRDWAVENSPLLSVQRANNLAPQYPPDVRARLAWFARIAVADGKDARWRSLASGVTHDVGDRGSSALTDTVRANKPRAIRATLADPAALLLRLRLGFGVGAKADVLAFLLGTEGAWASVRALMHATGYTTAAVRRAADDMAAARLIRVTRGSPTSYTQYSADRGAWTPVLQLADAPPLWRSWHERFTFALAFLAWADAARARPLSADAFGARARDLLERHRPAFERNLITVWSEHTVVEDWGAFVGQAVADLAGWMEDQA